MTRGEATRKRIIAAAAPVFNQRGFAGCSMQDLMEATGLEKGGLYRHFASKEELAVASVQYALQMVFAARMGGLEKIPGAIARLRHIVRAFVEAPSPVPGGCPLMNAAGDADAGCPEILRLAREGVGWWRGRLCEIIEGGMRMGEIRDDLEPRRMANAIIALLEGALAISRLEGSREAMFDARVTLDGLLDQWAR